MISGFEAGKKYLYRGRKQQEWARGMTFMLDGKPHKCVFGQGRCARFVDKNRLFHWGDLSDFEEAPTYTWTEPFKRGDKVEVWDDLLDSTRKKTIFLTYIEGAEYPNVCVDPSHAERYLNNNSFYMQTYKHARRIPEKKYEILGEEQMEELVGKKIVSKSGKYAYLVTGYSKVLFPIIYTVNGEHDAESLLKNFTYLDGSPCGVEV